MSTTTTTEGKKTGSGSDKVNCTEVLLRIEGDTVSTNWFHPKLTGVICALCGKNCQAQGKPLCVNANPFCG